MPGNLQYISQDSDLNSLRNPASGTKGTAGNWFLNI